jgi:outer membrane protein OmpA-like peptidoglycan-associated protein
MAIHTSTTRSWEFDLNFKNNVRCFMAANLIDLAKSFLSSELVHSISRELGEGPDHVEKAIDAGIPSILAGLLNTVSSSGANRLFDMLKQEPSELSHIGGLDGVAGKLGGLLSGGSLDALLKFGQSVLSALFGGKLNSIVDLISKASGVKTSSASSLLGLLAPLLMGVLKKETASRGLSLGSLTDLLMSQKDSIAKLAPAGLANVLGMKSLTDLGSVADSIKLAGAGAAREVGRTAADAVGQGTAWLRWAAPLALLAAVLFGLYYWYNGQAAAPNPAQAPDLAQAAAPAVDAVRNATERAAEGIKDAGKRLAADGKALIETASQQVSLSLPGNIKLNVPENSYLHSLVKFLTEGAGTGEAKSFVADNLSFEGATAKLTPDSMTSATSLATIMKAFSNLKLKIEGHTDNSGDAAKNKELALERATAVKDALVKAGAPADRIVAEGVGPDRPIASNDTDDGRAKNRRIELSVVAR